MTKLLSDIVTGNLYDAPSGDMLRDSNGSPDRPEDYRVVGGDAGSGYEVVGPSGQTDRTDSTDHSRLYRDV